MLMAETGVGKSTLSRWLAEARTLPTMPPKSKEPRRWSVEDKARIVAQAAKLNGEQLRELLAREGARFSDLEQWRLSLDEQGAAAKASAKRIRELERELARKEKALAEAAALLILKKKVDLLWGEDPAEDTDTDEKPEK